jgi:hypothetical protein
MPSESYADEVAYLRKSLRWTQVLAAVCFGSTSLLLLMGATRAPQVLRAKGLVIVDEQGREKILLGSPTPTSTSRLRKDAQTESLVFLGDDGSDRVIVGQTPNPYEAGQTSKRIAEGWGSLYFDPKGTERAGMGFLGNGRAAVVLDRPNGDALGMMVDDKSNYAGLIINYPSQETALELGVKDKQPFATLFDSDSKIRADLKLLGSERPVWEAHDAATAMKSPQ